MSRKTQKQGHYPYHYERARSLRAFEKHRLEIIQDDGVYRHLRFRNPHSFSYHFSLVTWPGYLAISGDMGSYMFSREQDMFGWFASAADWAAMPVEINPGYWGQKCQAVDRVGSLDEFDDDAFRDYIVTTFRDLDRGDFEPGQRLEIWRDIREDLLSAHFDMRTEAICAAMRFEIQDGSRSYHPFQDAWDCNFMRPSFHFLICCYAIVWGIKRYAQVKEGRDQAAHDRLIMEGAL